MSTRKLLFTIFGAILALLGLGLLAGGGVLLVGYSTQRDADGFVSSPSYEVVAGGSAVTSEDVALEAHPGDWFPESGDLRFRLNVTPTDSEHALFLGIADEDALDRYLAGVAHSEIVDVGVGSNEVTYRTESGGALSVPPGERPDLWVASVEGTGTQTLTWDAEPGQWAVALFNADGSTGVSAVATAAVSIDLLVPIAIGLLIAGVVFAAIGVVLLMVGAVGRDGAESAEGSRAGGGVEVRGDRAYPVLVEAALDPQLSRWKWLVKWVLALPHVFVLAFLWAAFVVLTFVAGVAILFTGRYPRGIFDFNVGVMRWTWRVTYYAYGVLGTDRYPPFSFDPDPDYPTAFDVVYPEELSRGLVLVKWWLLAIPHYLVVGLFTGGLLTWSFSGAEENGWQIASGGLVGLLVFIAAIALLFGGRYPRGLFNLVMGLQRWTWRVLAYAALMTDEYPPFRLDTGATEPPAGPPSAPPGPAPQPDQRQPAPA